MKGQRIHIHSDITKEELQIQRKIRQIVDEKKWVNQKTDETQLNKH